MLRRSPRMLHPLYQVSRKTFWKKWKKTGIDSWLRSSFCGLELWSCVELGLEFLPKYSNVLSMPNYGSWWLA